MPLSVPTLADLEMRRQLCAEHPPPPRPLCSLLSAPQADEERIASPSVADSESSGGGLLAVVQSSPGPPLRGAYSAGRARRGPGPDRRRTGPAHQRAGGYSAPEEGEDSCHQVRSLTAAPSAWRETLASPPFSRDRSPLDGPARSRVIHRMWGLFHSRTLDAVVEYALVREQLTCEANGIPNGEGTVTDHRGERRSERRVHLSEAASLLGVSKDAVRMRVKRGTLRSEKGEDGRVHVWVNDNPDADPNTVHPEMQVEAWRELIDELRDRVRSL